MPISAEAIVNKVSKLYSLPTVYTQLEMAINDPCSDFNQVAAILLDDAGLSARLLKLANSALYNFPSKIETISRAITIIGTKQLHELVLATCIISLFKNIPKEVLDMDAFWKHSIATGVCARTIATFHREPNVERFYVMGLLHDIGRLIMLVHMPDAISEQMNAAKAGNRLLRQLERDAFGFDHAEVAQVLLTSWRIPASVVKAVGCHHRPISAGEFGYEAAVIHFSDILVHALELGSSGEIFVPDLDDRAWQLLKLTHTQIPMIVELIESQYEEVVGLFLS